MQYSRYWYQRGPRSALEGLTSGVENLTQTMMWLMQMKRQKQRQLAEDVWAGRTPSPEGAGLQVSPQAQLNQQKLQLFQQALAGKDIGEGGSITR